jgi:hypothetical protein
MFRIPDPHGRIQSSYLTGLSVMHVLAVVWSNLLSHPTHEFRCIRYYFQYHHAIFIAMGLRQDTSTLYVLGHRLSDIRIHFREVLSTIVSRG